MCGPPRRRALRTSCPPTRYVYSYDVHVRFVMHTTRTTPRRRSLAENFMFTRSRRPASGAVRRTHTDETFVSQYLNGPRFRRTEVRLRRSRQVSPTLSSGTVWYLYLCSRPSDRSGPGCFSTDRNVRSKCRCSNVSCSSHYDAQLTAFFIDPRAK